MNIDVNGEFRSLLMRLDDELAITGSKRQMQPVSRQEIEEALRRLDAGLTTEEAVSRFKNHSKVEYIEPNFIVNAVEVPNDPMFPQLYGMQNTGQTGGTAGADIRATQA